MKNLTIEQLRQLSAEVSKGNNHIAITPNGVFAFPTRKEMYKHESHNGPHVSMHVRGITGGLYTEKTV